MDPSEAARNALECVFETKESENIIIFCDDVKMNVGGAFAQGAKKLGLHTRLISLQTDPKSFRKEIPQQIMPFLTTHRPDIYLNLMRGTREETPFRIKLIQLETSDHKTRLGHCPGVTEDMLTEGALALTVAEHRRMQNLAETLIEKLKQAETIEIRNPAGTEISLSVEGRPFFTDTKLDWKLMKWMNLPTGEVIVAPVENTLEGKLVCDMAIGGIGPVSTPLTIIAKSGEVQDVSSANVEVLRRVKDSLETDAMAKIVGEFAFGINSKARFIEEFLESEKILGTVHIAFGNNSDFPMGKNNSENHMDFMISKPTVSMVTETGTSISILLNGVFQGLGV